MGQVESSLPASHTSVIVGAVQPLNEITTNAYGWGARVDKTTMTKTKPDGGDSARNDDDDYIIMTEPCYPFTHTTTYNNARLGWNGIGLRKRKPTQHSSQTTIIANTIT